MFKKTSDNAQSRTDRNALHTRVNEAGIDPQVFEKNSQAPDEYRQLVLDKIELEKRSALVRQQFNVAKRRYRNNEPGQVPYREFDRLGRQRDDIAHKIQVMNGRIAELKLERAKAHMEQPQNMVRPKLQRVEAFKLCFYEVAKELLAEPIFKRLVNAALLRVDLDKERKHDGT